MKSGMDDSSLIKNVNTKTNSPNYINLPLIYNYDNYDKTFSYEPCELTTSYGIKSEMNQFGKYESSISFPFDERDPEQVKLLGDLDAIHQSF